MNSFDASYTRYFWDTDFRIDFSVDPAAPSCGYAESYNLIDTATALTEAFAWLEFDSATNEVVLRPDQFTDVAVTKNIDVEITMGTYTQAFSVQFTITNPCKTSNIVVSGTGDMLINTVSTGSLTITLSNDYENSSGFDVCGEISVVSYSPSPVELVQGASDRLYTL